MAPFVGILSGVWKGIHSDDDFFDRLNHRITSLILIVFAMLVGSKQYVGDPIVCWVPKVFTGGHKKYANNYCWIKNSYFMPFEERIPNPELPRAHIGYYQWVALVLLLQALLFYSPRIFWRLMSDGAGIDFNMIVKAIWAPKLLDPEKRKEVIGTVVNHLDRFLCLKQDYHKNKCSRFKEKFTNLICPFLGKQYGNYLFFLYLWVKCMYVCNAIGQLFLLNAFLGSMFHVYGFQVLSELTTKMEWYQTGRFPRVTLCDFNIRQLGGNIHRWTVQCALPINLFNEKIYMFLWFWMVYVAIATVWGMISWFSFLYRRERKAYIAKFLKRMGIISSTSTGDGKLVRKFITRYLRPDGAFILNLVGRNTNDIVIGELVAALWEKFKKDRAHLLTDRGLDEEGNHKMDKMLEDAV
ncbi:innexin unc-9 [Lingula anatina]|uniref:Innexin n=2 Tax=Lingula anatina TaxID=7574 RepID=A0A1S3JYK9_LINAN|nr:innexin unc-9 [Lingula anatina]|eukprot:XP_013415377.1 innexin unc-9 [Lingula anatina]